MEGLQVLRGYLPAGMFTLLLLVFAIMSITVSARDFLNAISPLRSWVVAIITWLRKKPTKSTNAPHDVERYTQQDGGIEPHEIENQASSENNPDLSRNLDRPILFFLINNVTDTMNRDRKKRRAKRGATIQQTTRRSMRDSRTGESLKDEGVASVGSLPPIDVNSNVAGSVNLPSPSVGDTMPADTADSEPPPSIKTVPVVTPQEAQPQTYSENESVIAGPASSADSSAEPSIDTTSVANDSTVIEAEPLDQESPADAARQATADAQADPTSDEGAEIEVDTTTNAGMDSDIPSADADLLPLGEVVDAPKDASAQARVEEAGETAHNQTHLSDQPVIDSFEPDNPQNANAGAAASFAEAIPVAQLTTRTYVPDPPRSGEQVPDGDLATPQSAQTTEAEADTHDRDIADIANNWPASAISATLQRLRQTRCLLPTDLSYDAGWVTAFEAGRWHTYQSDRQRYINGIRTYLQALGMTPAELQGHLPSLMRYQNGM